MASTAKKNMPMNCSGVMKKPGFEVFVVPAVFALVKAGLNANFVSLAHFR